MWWWDARRGSGQDLVTLAPRNWFVSRPQQDGTTRVLCPRTEGVCYWGKWQNWKVLGILGCTWLVLVSIFFHSTNRKCFACVLSNWACLFALLVNSAVLQNRLADKTDMLCCLSTHTTHFFITLCFNFRLSLRLGKIYLQKSAATAHCWSKYCGSKYQVLSGAGLWALPVRSWGRRRTHLQVNSAN